MRYTCPSVCPSVCPMPMSFTERADTRADVPFYCCRPVLRRQRSASSQQQVCCVSLGTLSGRATVISAV